MDKVACTVIGLMLLSIGTVVAFDPDSVMNHISYQDPGVSVGVLCQQYPDPSMPDCDKYFVFEGQSATLSLGPNSSGYGRPRPDVLEINDNAGVFDALGNQHVVGWLANPRRTGLFRIARTGAVTPLILFDLSAYPPATTYEPFLAGLHIDGVNGTLAVSVVHPYQITYTGCSCPVPDTWRADREMIEVSGLPTLLDIILSYQPPSTLSFNVPVRPEGLPGADSFSVYAGNVTTASDLSQATPLECSVPAGRPPVPGEHLTVPDTLPVPSPGSGRYYLAAAKHGAQIRAGRSRMGGQLQGRNAAALLACQ